MAAGNQALLEPVHHAQKCRVENSFEGDGEVPLVRRVFIHTTVGQKGHLHIGDLLAKALHKTGDEFTQSAMIRQVAQRITRRGLLAEVVIHRTDAVDGVAQKTQVEEEVSAHFGERMANLVARDRGHFGMSFKELQKRCVGVVAGAFGRVEAREAFAKIAVQDVFDGRAGVLQKVIVKQDEAHGWRAKRRL